MTLRKINVKLDETIENMFSEIVESAGNYQMVSDSLNNPLFDITRSLESFGSSVWEDFSERSSK